jgi:hypothetical protein
VAGMRPFSPAIEHVSVQSLKSYPRNARRHSRVQIKQIAASIERFGFNNPVLIADVMIEIASPATPQPSSFLPPRRRHSPSDAPGASSEHGRRVHADLFVGLTQRFQFTALHAVRGVAPSAFDLSMPSKFRMLSAGQNFAVVILSCLYSALRTALPRLMYVV